MEHLDVIDEHDNVLGRAPKPDIYSKKLMHRIVHVFVINRRGEVYLQVRAPHVPYLPGYHCTSAAGHISAGETPEQAAKRELKEELGLDAQVQYMHKLLYEQDEHKRFLYIFVAHTDEDIRFADGEVCDGAFYSKEETLKLIRKNVKIHPQLTACYAWLYGHWPSAGF